MEEESWYRNLNSPTFIQSIVPPPRTIHHILSDFSDIDHSIGSVLPLPFVQHCADVCGVLVNHTSTNQPPSTIKDSQDHKFRIHLPNTQTIPPTCIQEDEDDSDDDDPSLGGDVVMEDMEEENDMEREVRLWLEETQIQSTPTPAFTPAPSQTLSPRPTIQVGEDASASSKAPSRAASPVKRAPGAENVRPSGF